MGSFCIRTYRRAALNTWHLAPVTFCVAWRRGGAGRGGATLVGQGGARVRARGPSTKGMAEAPRRVPVCDLMGVLRPYMEVADQRLSICWRPAVCPGSPSVWDGGRCRGIRASAGPTLRGPARPSPARWSGELAAGGSTMFTILVSSVDGCSNSTLALFADMPVGRTKKKDWGEGGCGELAGGEWGAHRSRAGTSPGPEGRPREEEALLEKLTVGNYCSFPAPLTDGAMRIAPEILLPPNSNTVL